MTPHTILRFASLIIFTLASTALAYAAGPQRTFVSAQLGNDANTVNNCSVTQPCRNFNAAIGVVNAGGEVVALDSGGYGVVTISKAVTLTGPTGVYVAITALTAGSSAITVSAAGTDTVVLRGLTLTGLGGQIGIYVQSVGNLHVEGCVISGFTDTGINVNLTADGSYIFIKDTITRNNGIGIAIQTASIQGVRASIDNCRSERNVTYGFWAYRNSYVTINRSVASGNGPAGFIASSNASGTYAVLNCAECVSSNNVSYGFFASDNSRVTINRSVASGHSNSGFEASSAISGASAQLSCEECVSSNNTGSGFIVNAVPGAFATIRVSHSTATNNNGIGFGQINITGFESLGNNLVSGNGGPNQGTITIIGAQ